MSGTIAWMAAEAEEEKPFTAEGAEPFTTEGTEPAEGAKPFTTEGTEEHRGRAGERIDAGNFPAHTFPAKAVGRDVGENADNLPKGIEGYPDYDEADYETQRQRRIYRGRTIAMLRRYMKYSIETGRLPSLLGREFFRTQVTSYTVVTFEDRVIFVHDMEKCLERLDEFSRQIIARHILQEHDRWATARLLHCNEKTIRRLTPMALDLLSEILVEVGLLDRLDSDSKKTCQGGVRGTFSASDCEDGENKF